MARRQRKTNLDHTVEALARLPWQVCLVLAPLAYFGFHWLSQIQPPPAHDIAQLGSSMQVTIFKSLGMFMQWLAPMALVMAALLSFSSKRSRSRLLAETERRTSSAPLHQLSWREFEQLVGAHFERLGYSVSFTPDGADGGVDVVARKGSETFLIQCKQWRATRVGVSVVRELFGVMAARGATGAYVVSIGAFSSDARDFAAGRNITLVDADSLLKSAPASRPLPPSTSPRPEASGAPSALPDCPKCGAPMIRRVAKQGSSQGNAFYGCSTFPRCRGTMPA